MNAWQKHAAFVRLQAVLEEGFKMWYIILGYFLVSALVAILFWLLLIAAKWKDESNAIDSSKEYEDREMHQIANNTLLMDFTEPKKWLRK